MHGGIFDLEHVEVIWGHSMHFSKRKMSNLKTAHHRAKHKNLGLGGGGGVYMCSMHGITDLEHVKVIWGHSLHF